MLVKQLLHLLEGGVGIGLFVNVEAEHRLAPAIAQEMTQHVDLFQRLEKHLLMIAQKDAHRPPAAPARGHFQHTPAVGSTVDQIAQQDDGGLGGGGGVADPVVVLDRLDQLCEQVGSAMDVAHRIDPLARRNGGAGQGGAGPEKFAQAAQHSFCKIT
jgi:hypothetical protein